MSFWLTKKIRSTGWILKPKLQIIYQRKFRVLGPKGKQNSEMAIEKGEPRKVHYSFRLVYTKLRFMN